MIPNYVRDPAKSSRLKKQETLKVSSELRTLTLQKVIFIPLIHYNVVIDLIVFFQRDNCRKPRQTWKARKAHSKGNTECFK